MFTAPGQEKGKRKGIKGKNTAGASCQLESRSSEIVMAF